MKKLCVEEKGTLNFSEFHFREIVKHNFEE